MMPNYVCQACGREYWGWGAYHLRRAGRGLCCEECEGALVEKTGDGWDGFFDSDGPEAA